MNFIRGYDIEKIKVVYHLWLSYILYKVVEPYLANLVNWLDEILYILLFHSYPEMSEEVCKQSRIDLIMPS